MNIIQRELEHTAQLQGIDNEIRKWLDEEAMLLPADNEYGFEWRFEE